MAAEAQSFSLWNAAEQIEESLEREVPALVARALNYSGPLIGDPAPHWRALRDELRRLADLAEQAARHA